MPSRHADLTEAPPGKRDDLAAVAGLGVLCVLLNDLPVAAQGLAVAGRGVKSTYADLGGGFGLLLAAAGFVAGRGLLARFDAGQRTGARLRAAAGFWRDGALRFAPSAWLWLAVTLACVAGFNRSGAFGPPGEALHGAGAALLNLENLRLHRLGAAPQGPTFGYWALSLLAQFCLVLPLAALVFRRRLALALAAVVCLQLFREPAPGDLPGLLRLDALSLGGLLAIWTRDTTWRLFEPTPLRRSRLGRTVLPLALLALLLVTSSRALHIVLFSPGVAAVVAALLVWLAAFEEGYVLPDGLAKRLLAWSGRRALGLYLAHVPAYLATRELWFRLDPGSLATQPPHLLRFAVPAAALTLAFGELNWRLIEQPLRRLARRWRPDDARAGSFDRPGNGKVERLSA